VGGLGSGARWSKKPTADGCRWLDTMMLRKWGLLACDVNRTGTLRWGDGSDVAYRVTTQHDRGTLRLLYSSGAPPTAHDYTVRLEATPCRYGGRRWWFRCPLSHAGVACGARVRKLYLRGRWFGCRKCHGLVYRSSQERDGRVYALARAGLGALSDPSGMSVVQLGLAMKALKVIERRAEHSSTRSLRS
jgi:hypothetical protein